MTKTPPEAHERVVLRSQLRRWRGIVKRRAETINRAYLELDNARWEVQWIKQRLVELSK